MRPRRAVLRIAGYGLDTGDLETSVPGGGMIAGIGYVSGVRCIVVPSNSGIDAGAIQHMGRDKLFRAQELALRNKLPFVHLVESAGANLLKYRVEGFIHGGAIYHKSREAFGGRHSGDRRRARLVDGGRRLHVGLSDYVMLVRGRAKVFLAGPPLLKAATGEIAGNEELGGAEMHAHVSGRANISPGRTPTACASRAT